jgi:hypothetical protein
MKRQLIFPSKTISKQAPICNPLEIKVGSLWFNNNTKRVATVESVNDFKISIRYDLQCLLSKRVYTPAVFKNSYTKQKLI